MEWDRDDVQISRKQTNRRRSTFAAAYAATLIQSHSLLSRTSRKHRYCATSHYSSNCESRHEPAPRLFKLICIDRSIDRRDYATRGVERRAMGGKKKKHVADPSQSTLTSFFGNVVNRKDASAARPLPASPEKEKTGPDAAPLEKRKFQTKAAAASAAKKVKVMNVARGAAVMPCVAGLTSQQPVAVASTSAAAGRVKNPQTGVQSHCPDAFTPPSLILPLTERESELVGQVDAAARTIGLALMTCGFDTRHNGVVVGADPKFIEVGRYEPHGDHRIRSFQPRKDTKVLALANSCEAFFCERLASALGEDNKGERMTIDAYDVLASHAKHVRHSVFLDVLPPATVAKPNPGKLATAVANDDAYVDAVAALVIHLATTRGSEDKPLPIVIWGVKTSEQHRADVNTRVFMKIKTLASTLPVFATPHPQWWMKARSAAIEAAAKADLMIAELVLLAFGRQISSQAFVRLVGGDLTEEERRQIAQDLHKARVKGGTGSIAWQSNDAIAGEKMEAAADAMNANGAGLAARLMNKAMPDVDWSTFSRPDLAQAVTHENAANGAKGGLRSGEAVVREKSRATHRTNAILREANGGALPGENIEEYRPLREDEVRRIEDLMSQEVDEPAKQRRRELIERLQIRIREYRNGANRLKRSVTYSLRDLNVYERNADLTRLISHSQAAKAIAIIEKMQI